MKIIPKKRIMEEAEKIVSSRFSEFNMWGYNFKDNAAELFTPGYLFISFARSKGIITNKNLRAYLKKVFKTEDVLERRYEYAYQVMAFEFENETFVVWFNATGQGSTIETECLDHTIYHRFCLALLKKISHKVSEDRLVYAPNFVKKELSATGVLKLSYLSKYLASKKAFLHKIRN